MTTEVILNGDFENTSGIGVGQTPDDWVSVDSEVQTEGTFFGNGSGNLALEVDGQSGNTTSYSQTFTVDELGGASLTFDMGMRQAADIGTDGATVDISAAGGGASIFSATILPSVAGSFENFAFDVDFPNTGDFTITFTEIGDDSSVGAVLDNVSLITICFTPKTPILTPFGEKLAGDLKIGDLVLTQDRGPQPIRFIYRRRMRAKDIARPILFEPGAVGNKERLLVSQQHRLLMRSTGPGYIFQTQPPLLVNALHLVNGRNIKLVEHLVFVEYIHIMFDQHELVWSSGVLTESWQPHRRNLKDDDRGVREELVRFFPEIAENHGGGVETGGPVRRVFHHDKQGLSLLRFYRQAAEGKLPEIYVKQAVRPLPEARGSS